MATKKKQRHRHRHGGRRPGSGRKPSPSGPGIRTYVTLPRDMAAWLAAPYGGDLPRALREIAEAWRAQGVEALKRARENLTREDVHHCLDVANGLALTSGLLGQHLAEDLLDHGDATYAATGTKVALLDPEARAHLELLCRAWWAAAGDQERERVLAEAWW